jgi:DNA mismatch repair protein MutS
MLTSGEPLSTARVSGVASLLQAPGERMEDSLYFRIVPQSVQMTPMLRHYTEMKAQHPDAVVLYRMGDFYEVFFDDAKRVAPILEVTLTARHRGKESEVPMCGVPHHALEVYLGKLLRAGLKVALCDQVEDPAQAKGLVKREVIRVITPGTVSDPDLLESKEENLLAAVVWSSNGSGAGAFLDISTSTFFGRRWESSDQALQDLRVLAPKEVLLFGERPPAEMESWIERHRVCRTEIEANGWFDERKAAGILQRQLGTTTLRGFGLDEKDRAPIVAASLALSYARKTQQNDLSHLRSFAMRRSDDRLILDSTTLANLEVFRALRTGTQGGTLLSVVDRTITPPGGRLVREWLRRPLRDPASIGRRHEAVAELVGDERRRGRIREGLETVGDPARLLSRAVLGSLSPREAAALRSALEATPKVLSEVADARAELLAQAATVDPIADLATELQRVLSESPAASVHHGGVIASGVDAELDRVRSLANDSKKHLLAMEARERDDTGINSLKIRYNKVFGYYLEVTKANQDLVPDRYVRKQTLVNAERYVTPELKELEEQILSAEERQLEIEAEHFEGLRLRIVAEGSRLDELTRQLASLDVLTNLAEVAARNDYRRPTMASAGKAIEIESGRHPVVERIGGEFVPNDTRLDIKDGEIVVLTGPNMGGKRIFTRVGASDDLTRGESTFMVEMIETANILHHATAESLVILDEVGRGTATFDGLSLAWATVEFLHETVGAKTLFATHYHELTELASLLPRVVNRTMAVKEWENQIVFLRRVVPGSADKSYGIHVARLAGIPATVIARAETILANLEAQEYDVTGKPRLARGGGPEREGPDQLALFAPNEEVVAAVLRDIDLERLTPLAAINLLHSLKTRLED